MFSVVCAYAVNGNTFMCWLDFHYFCNQTSLYASASEPNSSASSPCSSPLLNHQQRHQDGHLQAYRSRDGYSSLERLNRRSRVNKNSLQQLFPRRTSLQTVITAARSGLASSPGSRDCSEDSSSSDGDVEEVLDTTEFIRNRKERSTVLVRRFYKNNQKVSADSSSHVQHSYKMWWNVSLWTNMLSCCAALLSIDEEIGVYWDKSDCQGTAVRTHFRGGLGGGWLLQKLAA